MSEKRFGDRLREHRVRSGKSLREVAQALGVSHVFLGEVERGVRPGLAPHHWAKLAAELPPLTEKDLERWAGAGKPLQLAFEDAPAKYQDLGLLLARRIRRDDLSDADLRKLVRMLSKDSDE